MGPIDLCKAKVMGTEKTKRTDRPTDRPTRLNLPMDSPLPPDSTQTNPWEREAPIPTNAIVCGDRTTDGYYYPPTNHSAKEADTVTTGRSRFACPRYEPRRN